MNTTNKVGGIHSHVKRLELVSVDLNNWWWCEVFQMEVRSGHV